jgi:hypothetical protein
VHERRRTHQPHHKPQHDDTGSQAQHQRAEPADGSTEPDRNRVHAPMVTRARWTQSSNVPPRQQSGPAAGHAEPAGPRTRSAVGNNGRTATHTTTHCVPSGPRAAAPHGQTPRLPAVNGEVGCEFVVSAAQDSHNASFEMTAAVRSGGSTGIDCSGV